MRFLSCVLALALLFLPTTPARAQFSALTMATSTNTASSIASSASASSNYVALIGLGMGLGVGAIGLGLAGSSVSSAAHPSFGGRIVAIYPYCLNAAVWITIVPAGGDPNPFYIWTPATITFSAGPPKSIGQQVLGLAITAPYQCVVSYYPYVALTGQPMFTLGTSAI